MKLSSNDLAALTATAAQLAGQAGRLILGYRNERVVVEYKDGGDSLASQVVTAADRASEALIKEGLQESIERFQLGFLGEESEDDRSRFDRDFFWCVDPLDGTLPFTEGADGFAVSIALISRSGEPMIGVVCDPAADVVMHATRGQGACRDSEPWAPSSTSKAGAFALYCDRSLLQHARYPEVLQCCHKIAGDLGRGGEVRIVSHGGAVMNACWALDDPPSAYFKFPKREKGGGSLWDYAATACIYSEVGAVASDAFGGKLELNRVDSTFLNHLGITYSTDSGIAEALRLLFAQ